MHESVKTLCEHRERSFRELNDFSRQNELLVLADGENTACDIRRKIADAFKVSIDAQESDDKAHILRGKRIPLKHLFAVLFDADLERIDLMIRVYNALCAFTIPRAYGENAATCVLLHQRAQAKEALSQWLCFRNVTLCHKALAGALK
jgi:hypothetical protein